MTARRNAPQCSVMPCRHLPLTHRCMRRALGGARGRAQHQDAPLRPARLPGPVRLRGRRRQGAAPAALRCRVGVLANHPYMQLLDFNIFALRSSVPCRTSLHAVAWTQLPLQTCSTGNSRHHCGNLRRPSTGTWKVSASGTLRYG